jgi:C_GCAxxG_C_C family probable redox protein
MKPRLALPQPDRLRRHTMSNLNKTGTHAVEKLLSGYNCAQAVLHANCARLGFERDAALQLACGLGAGMGQKEQVCGAVTAGILALGLRYGRGEAEDTSKTEETYLKTREFMDRFQARHGSISCRELIGCDLLTPEGKRAYDDQDVLHRTCAHCVRTAAELVDEMI